MICNNVRVLSLGQIQLLDMVSELVVLINEEWLQCYTLLWPPLWRSKRVNRFSGGSEATRTRFCRLQSDANTVYFHAITNRLRRKCSIPCLWADDVDARELSAHFYSFYKLLFMADPRSRVALAIDYLPVRAIVSVVENAELTLVFLLKEVSRAIMEMKPSLIADPDSLPVSFQKFWEHIQDVIMPIFQEFHIGTLDMSCLNFGMITWIPKLVGGGGHGYSPL